MTFTAPDAGYVIPPLTGHAATMLDLLTTAIRDAADTTERSRQRHIGPSEIGHPCHRRIAYRLLDHPKTNLTTDPLASIVGSGTHEWLAAAFRRLDAAARHYLIEQKVNVRAGLTGSADLYHRPTGTTIDWKIVGVEPMRGYRTNGPGEQYRTQAHLYGLGFAKAGEDVRHVAIVFLPRSGQLGGAHVWTEPFDPQYAVDALHRLDTIIGLVDVLGVEEHPEQWAMVPVTPKNCTWCPYFLPYSTDPAQGCAGDLPAPVTVPGRNVA